MEFTAFSAAVVAKVSNLTNKLRQQIDKLAGAFSQKVLSFDVCSWQPSLKSRLHATSSCNDYRMYHESGRIRNATHPIDRNSTLITLSRPW